MNGELACHVATSGVTRVVDERRVVGELGEPHALVARDDLAGLVGVLTELEPERAVPDVVQPERDERALDQSEDEHADRTEALDRICEGVDRLADRRPREAADQAQEQGEGGGGDGHEPLAGEEAQDRRQLDPEPLVVAPGRQGTDDDAAEDAGLQGRDPEDVGEGRRGQLVPVQDVRRGLQRRRHYGVGRWTRVRDDSRRALGRAGDDVDVLDLHEDADRLVEDQEPDGARQRCDTSIGSQTDGHADREQQGQVAEDDVTGTHHGVGDQQEEPLGDRIHVVDLLVHVLEPSAQAEEQAGSRQDGDRHHQCLAYALELTEQADLLFWWCHRIRGHTGLHM